MAYDLKYIPNCYPYIIQSNDLSRDSHHESHFRYPMIMIELYLRSPTFSKVTTGYLYFPHKYTPWSPHENPLHLGVVSKGLNGPRQVLRVHVRELRLGKPGDLQCGGLSRFSRSQPEERKWAGLDPAKIEGISGEFRKFIRIFLSRNLHSYGISSLPCLMTAEAISYKIPMISPKNMAMFMSFSPRVSQRSHVPRLIQTVGLAAPVNRTWLGLKNCRNHGVNSPWSGPLDSKLEKHHAIHGKTYYFKCYGENSLFLW